MTLVKQRLVTLGVLLGLGALGALLVTWQTHRSASDAEQKAQEARVLARKSSEGVREVVLKNPKGSFTIVREGDGWVISAPVRAAADAATIDALVTHLVTLERKGVVPPEGSHDRALFGLEPARFSVTLVDDKGERETLLAGEKNPFDGSLYVAKEGSDEVVLVAGASEYQLDKDLFALRDKRVLTLDSVDVSRVEVKKDGKPLYSFAKTGNDYTLLTPSKVPGDSVQLSALLSALSTANAVSFVAEEAKSAALGKYGLEKPALELTVTPSNSAPAKTLAIGVVGEGDASRYYATLGGAAPVVELSTSWLYDKVAIDPELLRDKHVLSFEREAVAELRIKAGEAELAFVRAEKEEGGDDWKMTKPEAADAIDSTLTSLVYRLWNLKALRTIDEEAKDLTLYGLDAPALRLELVGKDGAPLSTLLVGKKQADEQVVMAAGTRRVQAVAPSELADLATDAAAYKETEKATAP